MLHYIIMMNLLYVRSHKKVLTIGSKIGRHCAIMSHSTKTIIHNVMSPGITMTIRKLHNNLSILRESCLYIQTYVSHAAILPDNSFITTSADKVCDVIWCHNDTP